MRILVTGGAGFIGSHTVDLLLQRGHTVRVLDSLAAPVHRPGQRPDYLPAEVECIQGDVRDRAAWERALSGIEAVFHFAAYQDYLPDFSKFFHTNAAGTALLYELAVEKRLHLHKIVIASSQAIYGEGAYCCPRHGRQCPGPRSQAKLNARQWELVCPHCEATLEPEFTAEDAQLSPHTPYAMSKHAEEMLALNLGRRYGLPTVGLRYSITQGARQSFRNAYSGAMRIFAMQALAGQPLTVYEDGQQQRDFVYVGDVAYANLLAFENPRADYQAFNVGGGQACSVLQFAEWVAARAGTGSRPLVTNEYRLGDSRHSLSSVERLRALGWQPRGTPQASIDEYLAWAQRQPDFRNYADEARAHMKRVGSVRA